MIEHNNDGAMFKTGRKLIFWILLVLISGCASNSEYVISPDWDKSKLATLHIYRTNASYHRYDPEKPFFYFNGKRIGKLGALESVSIEVPLGTHMLSVRGSFLFIPALEMASLEINIQENGEYYVRYSHDIISGVWVNLSPPTRVSFDLVDEQYFLSKK